MPPAKTPPPPSPSPASSLSKSSVNLAASGTGGVSIGAATLQSWDNSSGGVFTFPVSAQDLGAFTLTALDNAFNQTGSNSSNAVVGVSNVTVDNNVNLAVGQNATVDVTVAGVFTQPDTVSLVSSGNLVIGTPTIQSWDNNTGGVFAFPVTGQSIGGFSLSAPSKTLSVLAGRATTMSSPASRTSASTTTSSSTTARTAGSTSTSPAAFASQDTVALTASPANLSIGSPNVIWNNATGGTFSFPVTGQNIGAFTLAATESTANQTASSSNNTVSESAASPSMTTST